MLAIDCALSDTIVTRNERCDLKIPTYHHSSKYECPGHTSSFLSGCAFGQNYP